MGGLKKRTLQTKRSPQYSSGSSTRNENFRKQRRFDGKGVKNYDDINRHKSKKHDNTLSACDSQKNSACDNTKGKNDSYEVYSKAEILGTWKDECTLSVNDSQKNSAFDNTKERNDSCDVYSKSEILGTGKVCGKDSGNISAVSRTCHNNKNKTDSFQACPKPEDIDGFWSNTDQSHIKWKLSEEETDKQETKNQKKQAKNVITRNDSNDNQFTSKSKKGRPKEQCKEKNKRPVPCDNGLQF
jgi:hypothetical protein